MPKILWYYDEKTSKKMTKASKKDVIILNPSFCSCKKHKQIKKI